VPPAETIPAREPSFARKALPLQRAVVAHSNQKAETMSAEQLKERLHLRIEQADERLLAVLAGKDSLNWNHYDTDYHHR
jgi:RNase H-fold protein (predicted Holliday junction resolvase)